MSLELCPRLVREFSCRLESLGYLIELDFSGPVGIEHIEYIQYNLLSGTQGYFGPERRFAVIYEIYP